MKDKHIQSWMIGIFSTVLVVGAVASFVGQKQTFFKGTDLLGAAQNDMRAAQASLLTADSLSKSDEEYFSIIAEENKRRIKAHEKTSEDVKVEAAPSPVIRIKPKTASSTPGCAAGTMPVVRDGRLVECRDEDHNFPLDTRSLVTRPLSVEEQSCESQGKWTYTGPDRPGLLYGMCTECATQDYIFTNGSCQK